MLKISHGSSAAASIRACVLACTAFLALSGAAGALRADDVQVERKPPLQLAPSAEPSAVPAELAAAAADMSSKFKVDAEDPERSVPTPEQAMRNPLEMGYLMMDLIARAEAASQRGDHAAAVRYYRALGKAVPDRAVSFGKLCRSYDELGDVDAAIEACRQALGKGGVGVDDHVLFVRLLLKRVAALQPNEIEDIEAVVTHLKKELSKDPKGLLVAMELECQLGARLEDAGRLRACTKQLMALAPKDPRTFTFRWALALQERELAEAESVIADAKQAPLPPVAVEAMQTQLASVRSQLPGWLEVYRDWRIFGALVLLVALGLVLMLARKKPTLRTAA